MPHLSLKTATLLMTRFASTGAVSGANEFSRFCFHSSSCINCWLRLWTFSAAFDPAPL
jgi:hypothetical protein